MSSPQNNDHKSSEGCHTLSPNMLMHQHQQQHHRQQQQQQQQNLFHMQQQQMQNYQQQQQTMQLKPAFESESCLAPKRNLYAIKEQPEDGAEDVEQENKRLTSEMMDNAYDADVDDDIPMRSIASVMTTSEEGENKGVEKAQRVIDERQHIYELFQPWALKTYGDQAKTKTITMRKKVRILKALEGKEHSRPDSSKFRFWVKTKGFTTKRPESFEDAPCTPRHKNPLPPNAILSDNPADVDLYVASTNKDFEKRHYRKVAVVEEFFDIIYNIHMELGGRSGMHAGQKRTYRIISETYAFLPREAVTRFLSICPECKKNLRPSSPSTSGHVKDEVVSVAQNESSSEIEVLNYSLHTESSLEAGPTTKTSTKLSAPVATARPMAQAKKRRYSNPDNNSKAFVIPSEQVDLTQSLPRRYSSPIISSVSSALPPTSLSSQMATSIIPKIRVNPSLQRPFTPPITESSPFAHQPNYSFGFDLHSTKSQDNLMRYYEFMRRLYTGNLVMPQTASTAHLPPPPPLPTMLNKGLLPSVQTKDLEMSFSKPLDPTHSNSSSEDDGENITVLSAKRFKSLPRSPDATKVLESSLQLQIQAIAKDFKQTTQICAINLSKNSSSTFSCTDKLGPEPRTPTAAINVPTTSFATTTIAATSTPISIKSEAVTPPKSSCYSSLRIPQMRSVNTLPPLDFERLKPITSTYLQLTRSMGLSDEEALRFDNLKKLTKLMLQIMDRSSS